LSVAMGTLTGCSNSSNGSTTNFPPSVTSTNLPTTLSSSGFYPSFGIQISIPNGVSNSTHSTFVTITESAIGQSSSIGYTVGQVGSISNCSPGATSCTVTIPSGNTVITPPIGSQATFTFTIFDNAGLSGSTSFGVTIVP
jgi:hypothetical protein